MADETIELPYDTVAMTQLATEFLLEPQRKPRDNSKIRASTAGNCPRQIGHMILDSPQQPKTAHAEYTFWVGHALGDAMTFVLRRMGWVDCDPFINDEGLLDWHGNSEGEIEDDNFKGHFDILTHPLKVVELSYYDEPTGKTIQYKEYAATTADDPLGRVYLVDFKTMSDRLGFFFPKDKEGKESKELIQSAKGNWYYKLGGACLFPGQFTKLRGIPKNYWEQLHIYARAKKADGVMLIVMGKDVEKKTAYPRTAGQHLFDFPVKIFTSNSLDEPTLTALDEKASYIYGFTNNGELPPIPEEYASGDKFPCPYCDCSSECFPNLYPKKPGLRELRPQAYQGFEVKGKS